MKRGNFKLGPCSVSVGPGLSVIWGPSGSGKSTLLGLIAGLFPATEGTVSYGEIEIARVSDSRRALLRRTLVAVGSQQPVFLPGMTLTENIALALRVRGVATENPEDWLMKTGLGLMTSRFPERLSGGELARAETARALAGTRMVVCLDEPTAMLDDMNAARIIQMITDAMRTRFLVCATHDPRLKERATTVWTLNEGRLVE